MPSFIASACARDARFGDGGIHQHAVAAELHGDGGVGRGAHACIDQHGNLGLLDDALDVERV